MSRAVHAMFSKIAYRYDLLNDVLSFGVHRLWRKEALRFAKLNDVKNTLDLCCGTGDFAFEISKKLRGVAAEQDLSIGVDFVKEMVSLAKLKADKSPEFSETKFLNGDAMALPFRDNSFDLLTIAFGIRNVDDTGLALIEAKRVLAPGGKLIVLEFGQPYLPVFSQIYNFYSTYLMPKIGALLAGAKEAYRYLPETAAAYPCAGGFTKFMEEAAFQDIRFKALFFGVAYIYVGSK